jgi:hypothetical protein
VLVLFFVAGLALLGRVGDSDSTQKCPSP